MPTSFHCLIHLRGRPVKVVVWNGVKNYKNQPDGEARKIIRTYSRKKFLKDLAIMAEDQDSIVLWTANESAYRVFIKHLTK
jgi:hypothetical protein